MRLRKSLPFLNGLRVWLAVALLAVAAVLLYTNLASAQQSSTERTRPAPALNTVAGEGSVELSRDAATGAQSYELLAWTSVDAQQQQDLDPVYITTLRPPADGGQQAIVMPRSVTVSEDDPWFGPFYTLNDPDRSVSIDILNDYGFIAAYYPNNELCNIPNYVSSSLAMGYQSAASNGFYVRRCPGFEHLTSIYLRVTTYPDAEVYTTHHIRVISRSDPTPTSSARTATPTSSARTATPTATSTVTPTVTPTATLEENAAATASPTATPSVMTLSKPVLTAEAGEGAVKLIWTAVTGAQRYVLMVWTSAWQQIGGDDLTGTNFSHTGLTFGTTYYYAVRAVNAAGQNSPWSHYLTVAVPAAPASESDLSVPMLIAAPEQSRVLLNWSSVPDATRYELWVWDSVKPWRQIGGDTLTGTTYTHTGVTAGTTYYYAIHTVNANGKTSAWSQSLPATVPAP